MLVRRAHSQKGFTLIELLMVVAIITLLSSIIFGVLNTSRERARDARRLSDLDQIRLALELYRNEYGVYPDGAYPSSDSSAWATLGSFLQDYLAQMPRDPINNGVPTNGTFGYYYCATADTPADEQTDYDLIALLETDHDLRCANRNWRNDNCDAGGLVPGNSWCGVGPDGAHIYDAGN